MTDDPADPPTPAPDPTRSVAPQAEQDEAVAGPPHPPWAKNLRQLYNSVVEEPLPSSFLDLLSQLDAQG